MTPLPPTLRTDLPRRPRVPLREHDDVADSVIVEMAGRGPGSRLPTTLSEALARMTDAEDTLRAIGAGDIDAFVVSDGGTDRRVFTLATADRPYRIFVENMQDGAATLSSSGIVLYANRRLTEMLARPLESVVGGPMRSFVAADEAHRLDQICDAGLSGTTCELDLVDGQGSSLPVLVGAAPLTTEGDLRFCLTFTDLTAQKAQDREIARLSQSQAERLADLQAAQAALTKQATHDALTGLPNRNLLVDRVDQAISHSKRTGRRTAVYFVDLDRFKHINDTEGHDAGDAVLCRVARQLIAVLRPMDTVARIGGDEFIVLAPDVDSHVHAVDIGNRLVAALWRRPDRGERAHRISASVGLAVSVGGRGAAEVLIKEADTAMYQAKALGGGRAEVFDAALGNRLQQRTRAEQLLESALDDDRIVAYYQPVVDLGSGMVSGFEALARIASDDGSIVVPASFIPVAEDSGLVVPLGTKMLDLACGAARQWQPGVLSAKGMTVAVNLSARQFEPGDLPAVVQETLAVTGLEPANLHLELTETAIIDLRPTIIEQLRVLHEMGVQIGLDDFGTGYASLTHLRRLPLTFVKIDQTFVQGLGVDQEDDRIVASVVDLAANLGLRSIAEGVETPDQLARLRSLGCDQAQGFLFAGPLPPGEVPGALLTSW